MERVSKKDLEQAVRVINTLLGTPQEPYSRDKDFNLVKHQGCYYLDGAYGGYQLEQISGDGARGIIPENHHVPKKDLMMMLEGFIAGLETKGANA